MTEKKTLKLRDDTEDAPKLEKKGRGWKISDKRLDALHDRAREMKRFASPANKALAEKFAKADLGRYTFKRFAVVGSAIVDFNCHNLGMAIIIEEEGDDPAISRRRDKSLESVGIRVMRIQANDINTNIDGVLERITLGMRMRISNKRDARREHWENSQPKERCPAQASPQDNAVADVQDSAADSEAEASSNDAETDDAPRETSAEEE